MSVPSCGMKRRRVKAGEILCHETTSVSTVEPKAMASRTAENQRISAMSASSTEAVTKPTAQSMSLRFEPLPQSRQQCTRPLRLPRTPSPSSEEWTLNKCKPTSGTKRISQRSREKAKPSEYSGCSPGNRLFHQKLIFSSRTTTGHGSVFP